MITIYEIFRGKIAEQKKLKRITDEELAKRTGYSLSTIRAFNCGVRDGENVAKAIAKVLNIEL